jgi:hypothetical protein
MPPAHAAAGKNIKNVAVNSPGGVVIKFQALPFTSDKPSAYNKIIHTTHEVVPGSLGFVHNLINMRLETVSRYHWVTFNGPV